jgi:hypothetical protein
MKDYFSPIKFNKKDLVIKKKEKPFPAKHLWSVALDEIHQEISKIEIGGSRFGAHGVQVKGGQPAMAGLHRFAQDPCKKNFDSLINVLPQDFGRAGEHFINLLKAVLESNNGKS